MRVLLLALSLSLLPMTAIAQAPGVNPRIEAYLRARRAELDEISAERRSALERLARFVRERGNADAPAPMTFICTHNSRRSHMAQLWAQAAARWLGVDALVPYSGGTEATAFNPRAVAALRRAGFAIEAQGEGSNPRYAVRTHPSGAPLVAFSKTYDDAANPSEGFAAVMTCSSADRACPQVQGAALRVALPYDDPKASDGTPEEAETYDARSRQIAREMLYLVLQAHG